MDTSLVGLRRERAILIRRLMESGLSDEDRVRLDVIEVRIEVLDRLALQLEAGYAPIAA